MAKEYCMKTEWFENFGKQSLRIPYLRFDVSPEVATEENPVPKWKLIIEAGESISKFERKEYVYDTCKDAKDHAEISYRQCIQEILKDAEYIDK